VAPENVELLRDVKDRTRLPISSGERLYTLADFARLINLRGVDVVQMDVAHCGGIAMAKKVAAMASAQDIGISPHCSVGPVAFAAALHVAWSTPNMLMLESFAEFDVDWRNDLVSGWNPLNGGKLALPEASGLGLSVALGRLVARRVHGDDGVGRVSRQLARLCGGQRPQMRQLLSRSLAAYPCPARHLPPQGGNRI
jgi:galactonate dehydratase